MKRRFSNFTGATDSDLSLHEETNFHSAKPRNSGRAKFQRNIYGEYHLGVTGGGHLDEDLDLTTPLHQTSTSDTFSNLPSNIPWNQKSNFYIDEGLQLGFRDHLEPNDGIRSEAIIQNEYGGSTNLHPWSDSPQCVSNNTLTPDTGYSMEWSRPSEPKVRDCFYSSVSGPTEVQALELMDGPPGGFMGVHYDTCFGALEDITMSCQEPPLIDGDSQLAVNLRFDQCSNLIFVHREDENGKPLGLLNTKFGNPLWMIRRKFRIHINAYVTAQIEQSAKQKLFPMSLVLYGFLKDFDEIGDDLCDAHLFLQNPVKFDRKVPYRNPQVLGRPGDIDSFHIEINAAPTIHLKEKSEITIRRPQDQLAEIFDDIEGPDCFTIEELSPRIITPLKGYQEKAVSMMIEKESGVIVGANFGSLWETMEIQGKQWYQNSITGDFKDQPGRMCRGGLLADEMGLGKTLTALALIATTLDRQRDGSEKAQGCSQVNNRCTLIVTPKGTLDTWDEQMKRHLKPELRTYLYHGDNSKKINYKQLLKYDVIVTTYETLRADYFPMSNKTANARKILYSFSWSRVVLDEAHFIRNGTSKVTEAVNALKAKHRWCLTGTPIQNRIEDFGSLLKFLQVDPFHKAQSFRKHISEPLQKGDEEAIRRLRSLVRAVALRRTKHSVGAELDLPTREDRTCTVAFSHDERNLYNLCRDNYWSIAGDARKRGSKSNHGLLQCILRLRQICDHGQDLLPLALQERIRNHLAVSQDFLDMDHMVLDEKSPAESTNSSDECDACGESLSEEDEIQLLQNCSHLLCRPCMSRAQGSQNVSTTEEILQDPLCPACLTDNLLVENACEQSRSYVPSSKVKALLKHIHKEKKDQCKSVIFSCWTGMLDRIEQALVNSSSGVKFVRLDGSTSMTDRRSLLNTFRSNPSCTVMLASIGSVGVGVDLTVASRVHLMEPQWNPMQESQALDRVYRIGQKRAVITYRYIVEHSIDEYLADLQQKKLQLIEDSLGSNSTNSLERLKEALLK